MSSAPTFEVGQMFFYKLGDGVSLVAGERGARVMNLGGETLGGSRYIWWNFVASWKESIEAARGAWRAGDWAHGRLKPPPTDNQEFIPLPEK